MATKEETSKEELLKEHESIGTPPIGGGVYLRQADGSLSRVGAKPTAAASSPAPAPDAPSAGHDDSHDH
jgi:hypothetical protein